MGAVTPEGQLLGTFSWKPGEKSGLYLIDPTTKALTSIPWPSKMGAPVGQIIDEVATRRWIVWLVSRSTDPDQTPWKLYSYDRRRHVSRLLGSAPRTKEGFPSSPGYSWPSVDGSGRVYLDEVRDVGTTPTPFVASVPADGSAPLRVVTRGIAPHASGEYLAYARSTGKVLTVWRKDLGTGRSQLLYDGRGTNCNSGDGLVSARGRTAILVQCVDPREDEVLVYEGAKPDLLIRGHDLNYLEMTSAYLSVAPAVTRQAGFYRQVVYRFGDRDLFTLGGTENLGDTPGSGPLLEWGAWNPKTKTTTTHLIRLR